MSITKKDSTPEKRLSHLLPFYQANKVELDYYKRLADGANKEIKEIMLNEEMGEFESDNLIARISKSERTNFIDELLIDKIKSLGIKGIIKKKEYVDMDKLESAIYHGEINAAELANCQEIKEVVTLRISVKKD